MHANPYLLLVYHPSTHVPPLRQRPTEQAFLTETKENAKRKEHKAINIAVYNLNFPNRVSTFRNKRLTSKGGLGNRDKILSYSRFDSLKRKDSGDFSQQATTNNLMQIKCHSSLSKLAC